MLLDAIQHRGRRVGQWHALGDEGIAQSVVVGEFVVGVDGVRESDPPSDTVRRRPVGAGGGVKNP